MHQRFERGAGRLLAGRTAMLLALVAVALFALPAISSADTVLPGATVLVCQVTGSVAAPTYAAVNVSVDQVAAYLNQYPGSFAGSCPSPPSTPPAGGGAPSAAVLVCQVTGNASLPFTQVSVAVDQLAAYLNQNPGAFAGSCPPPAGGGATGGSGVPSAAVSVCKVTGTVGALSLVQVSVSVDQVAAFLNQHPGSFVGGCALSGTGSNGGNGAGGLNGGLTVCHVTASAATPFAQANVAVDDLAAYLNRHPGSFVGTCPRPGDPNGTPGSLPSGFVTICRVTGNATSPYATVTVALRQLAVYLTQAGTIAPAPSAGCPTAASSSGNPGDTGGGPGATPSTTTAGTGSTVVVQTTPNTVVTAKGAGVKAATKSNRKGRAVIKIKPKHAGIVTVKAGGGKIVRRIGVLSKHTRGIALTG